MPMVLMANRLSMQTPGMEIILLQCRPHLLLRVGCLLLFQIWRNSMKKITVLIFMLCSLCFSQQTNQSVSKPLTLNGVTALSITTSTLPSFFVGKAYTATLTGAGGVT